MLVELLRYAEQLIKQKVNKANTSQMLEPTIAPVAVPVPTLHQPLHSKVSNYLNDQRRTGQFCDLKIELENGENFAWAHFCVVGAQSEFIGDSHLLQKSSLQFSIHNPLKVTIRNFTCVQCLDTILDFFYEDMVSVAKEHEEHFKNLAKILTITELIKLFALTDNDVDITASGSNGAAALDATATNGENVNKHNDINVAIENVFEQRNYFKVHNPRVNSSSSSKMNYCIGCDFKCYRVQEMISHMSICEPSHLTCSICEIGFLSWRHYDVHLKKHSSDAKKPFFCFECNARFTTRAALVVHHPKHSVETPYVCPHCSKAFKWKQGLSNHLLVHNAEKQMLCDVCGFSTTHMKALKSHKLSHTGELFKCSHPGCYHTANRKENLKIHMDTHKQERPFVCEVCGYKFSQSKNLKRHALKHSTEDINKHKCQLCSFASHRSDKLKEHMQRIHTEKAVQLELPEIMENSFENQDFDLPPLPLNLDEDDAKSKVLQKQKCKKRKTRSAEKKKCIIVKRLKPIKIKPLQVVSSFVLNVDENLSAKAAPNKI